MLIKMFTPLFFGIIGFLARWSLTTASPDLFANIPWPPVCEKRSYCHEKPVNYPQETFDKLLYGVDLNADSLVIANRSGSLDMDDVGGCQRRFNNSLIYLIKDDSDTVRFVAQTKHFTFGFLIEECEKPGQISQKQAKMRFIRSKRVHCHEMSMPILFPVLSLNGTDLESAAPKGGIPLSCSTKLMKKVIAE